MTTQQIEFSELVNKVEINDIQTEEIPCGLEYEILQGEQVHQLLTPLIQNSHVKILTLTGQSINSAAAQELRKVFETNTTLTTANLGGTHLGNDGTKLLCEGLINNKTLKNLDLNTNEIDDEGAVHLAAMLRENEGLEEIDLTDNYIGHEGFNKIGEALKQNPKSHLTTFSVLFFAKKNAAEVTLIEEEIKIIEAHCQQNASNNN